MPKINVLPQHLADKISAGEVAERPSSVVKELVENSIDAFADKITVEIKNGGVTYIRITDNGCGIEKNEAELAFCRHATSKIQDEEDLYKISTMGFRGEALASICAVSDIEVITKTSGAETGAFLKIIAGDTVEKQDIACMEGTTIIVANLFSNVPARMKFLKKDAIESGYVADVVARIAMANPKISFCYICDDKEVFYTSGDGNIKNAILSIYGRECARASLDVYHEDENIKITGVIGTPEVARGNRARETIFVNDRYVKNFLVSKVVEDAYRNILMTGKFPFFVLNITVPYDTVDVNVHPAKTEIKFADEKWIYDNLYKAVKNTLYTKCVIPQPINSLIDETDDISTMINFVDANMHKTNAVQNTADLSGSAYLNRTHTEEFNRNENTVKEPTGMNYLNLKSAPDMSAEDGIIEIKDAHNVQIDDVLDDKDTNKNENFARPYWFENIKIDTNNMHDELFSKRKIIGQLFDTYILVEKENSLFLIDQHAAHERLNYERIMEEYKEAEDIGQMLLVPVVMELSAGEKSGIVENSEYFKRFGFTIEEFGENAVIIEQVPVSCNEQGIKDLIIEISDTLQRNKRLSMSELESKIIYSIACKSAIKANKKLTSQEAEKLVDLLDDMENINTCPHGRPIQISFTKYNIEKMFKRIV